MRAMASKPTPPPPPPPMDDIGLPQIRKSPKGTRQ